MARTHQDGSWSFKCYEGMKAVVKIDSIKCRLKTAEVYKRVTIPPDMDE